MIIVLCVQEPTINIRCNERWQEEKSRFEIFNVEILDEFREIPMRKRKCRNHSPFVHTTWHYEKFHANQLL